MPSNSEVNDVCSVVPSGPLNNTLDSFIFSSRQEGLKSNFVGFYLHQYLVHICFTSPTVFMDLSSMYKISYTGSHGALC